MDDDSKLTLHGLQQHYCKLKDNEKNRKLFELLDVLEFNQVNMAFLFRMWTLSVNLSLELLQMVDTGRTCVGPHPWQMGLAMIPLEPQCSYALLLPLAVENCLEDQLEVSY